MNPLQTSVTHITALQYVEEVANCPIPVLVTFTSSGCSACGKMLGTLETMVKVYQGRLKFVVMETSTAGEVLLQHRQSGTPMSLMLLNGVLVQSPMIQSQEMNQSNSAVWLGNAMYIQYFVNFLDNCLHAINTNQLTS